MKMSAPLKSLDTALHICGLLRLICQVAHNVHDPRQQGGTRFRVVLAKLYTRAFVSQDGRRRGSARTRNVDSTNTSPPAADLSAGFQSLHSRSSAAVCSSAGRAVRRTRCMTAGVRREEADEPPSTGA